VSEPTTDDLKPPAKSAAKTARIAAALSRQSLPALPDGPPALTRAYALVLPTSGWAVFLSHGRSQILPVFTDPDRARAFLAAARVPPCRAAALATAEAVAEFLRSPPGRRGWAGEFLVAVDPVSLTDLTPVLYAPGELIAAIGGGSAPLSRPVGPG
jgi:hypothetical protein